MGFNKSNVTQMVMKTFIKINIVFFPDNIRIQSGGVFDPRPSLEQAATF